MKAGSVLVVLCVLSVPTLSQVSTSAQKEEKVMEWYVDGKRIEPGKPYDPNAPPYEPKLTKPSDK